MSEIQKYIDRLNNGERLTKIDLINENLSADDTYAKLVELIGLLVTSKLEMSINLEGTQGLDFRLNDLLAHLSKLKKLHLSLVNCGLSDKHFSKILSPILDTLKKGLKTLAIYNNEGITSTAVERLLKKGLHLVVDSQQVPDPTVQEKLGRQYKGQLSFMPITPGKEPTQLISSKEKSPQKPQTGSPSRAEELPIELRIDAPGKRIDSRMKGRPPSTEKPNDGSRTTKQETESSSKSPDPNRDKIEALRKKLQASLKSSTTPQPPNLPPEAQRNRSFSDTSKQATHDLPSNKRGPSRSLLGQPTSTYQLVLEHVQRQSESSNTPPSSKGKDGASTSQSTSTPHSPLTPSSPMPSPTLQPPPAAQPKKLVDNDDAGSSDSEADAATPSPALDERDIVLPSLSHTHSYSSSRSS